MSEKPAFDPSQPFEAVAQEKPAFDPNAPFEAAAPSGNESNESEPTGKLMSAVSGLGQGASLGFGDELAGVAGASIESIMADDSKPFIERYREARDFARNLNSRAKSDNPWTYGLGEVAGGAAATAPFGGAANTIYGSSALGGAYGLGASGADLTKGEVGNSAIDAGKGALAAGAFTTALKALPKISAPFSDLAEQRATKALGGNKSTFREGLKTGRNIGREALDEGIISPFRGTEGMLAKAEDLKAIGGRKMDDAFRMADASGNAFNPEDVANAINNKMGDFYRSPLNRDLGGQLDNMLEAVRMRGKGSVPLSEAQALKEELSRVGYPKGKMPLSPSDKQIMAQDAVRVVRDKMDDAANSLLGESGKSLLKRGRELYGTGAKAEELLQGKLAGEMSSGGFKISDVWQKPLSGALGTGNQALAADGLSKILKNSPQIFGRFAAPLTQAMMRGPEALSSANHVLMTGSGKSSEEYRAMMRNINGSEQPNE